MPEYIPIPDTYLSPETILDQMFTDFADAIPGWLPSEGNAEVALMEATAYQISELRRLQTQVPISIFRYFGSTIVGIPPVDAVSATMRSTWTVVDTDGYVIQSGTQVGFRVRGEIVPFIVRDSVTVPSGIKTTLKSQVTLEAVNPGNEANGIVEGSTGELIDTLAFVDTITTEEVSAGGVDAETDLQYINRLSDQFALFSPRAIVPADFEGLARSVPGVARAVAVDGYNPSNQSSGNAKTVLVSVIDINGDDVSETTLGEVKTLLQREREINFVVNVVNPTRTKIDVSVKGIAYAEFELDDVKGTVTEAINTFLSAANWGLPRFGDQLLWLDERTVRYLDLVAAVGSAEGLEYATEVKLAKADQNLGTNDVVLTGIPALPQPDEVTVVIKHA